MSLTSEPSAQKHCALAAQMEVPNKATRITAQNGDQRFCMTVVEVETEQVRITEQRDCESRSRAKPSHHYFSGCRSENWPL